MYYHIRSFLQADPIFCIFLFTIKLLWEFSVFAIPPLKPSIHTSTSWSEFPLSSQPLLSPGFLMIFMWLSPMSTFKTLSYQILSLIGDTFCHFNSPLFIFHLLLKYLLLIFFCRILHHFLLRRVYSKKFCLSSLFYETSPGFHLILSLKLSLINWWPPSSAYFSCLLLFSQLMTFLRPHHLSFAWIH